MFVCYFMYDFISNEDKKTIKNVKGLEFFIE